MYNLFTYFIFSITANNPKQKRQPFHAKHGATLHRKFLFFSSLEKVQKELDAVLGSSHQIDYEDRKKLPYTNAVIHEIIRFSSIILITIPRQAVKDTTVLGYQVPKVSCLFQCDLWPHLPAHYCSALSLCLDKYKLRSTIPFAGCAVFCL